MVEPHQLLEAGLAALDRPGVDLGEVRLVDLQTETIEVKGQEVEQTTHSTSRGVGIRVLSNGAWGYAATSTRCPEDVRRCAGEALELAQRNKNRVFPAQIVDLEPQQGQYRTPVQRDYFEVPLDEKLNLLFAATEMLNQQDKVTVAKATTHGLKRKTWLASTHGTNIQQEISLCGAGVTAIAVADGEVQIRTYPKENEGDARAAGWEFVEELDIVGVSEKVGSEAAALLSAPTCPSGRKTLIIDGSQLSLQIHESCGHPSELDRALGEEISLAGCSFLRPERLNNFTYGSPKVTLYADSTTPGGPGTFGWDDEGVPAGRWDLIKEGKQVGYLGSRETAGRVAKTQPGAMRAQSWQHTPIVRMVNVNLEPGDCSLDEMIADTKDGLFVKTNRSWSIDDFRRNFQFSCEIGWEIKNGKITQMVKNPVYTGITPEFWQSCDAVGDESHWRMWGWLMCGKGDPMQIMHVGHGCSPARFRDVEVGRSNAR